MPYDLFISYSRRDNQQGRITQLVERIKTDFAPFAKRELVPFFDQQEIAGMQDWRQRILQGLRESRLLLACLSPAYLQSEYCEWEFVEYLKYEIGHLHGFNGVAPIYFVEVPGWTDRDFEQKCAAWVAELRKRQHFDLRPWHDQGEEALRETAVQERMGKLHRQIVQTITRGERAEKSLGNVDAHNPHFIGRTASLRMLRDNFVKPGHIGVVTAVNGVGGLGKTALAIEYAHAFADEYGGGRWQVRCAGKDDLRLALAELATPIGFEFTDDEKKNADLQFERTRRELKKLADAHEPHRCLLILDNVDRPDLLDPAQVARLNGGDWLHVLATTRLGENELHGAHRDRSFLAIDQLSTEDALALIESYQPDGRFRGEAERDAAREIVRLLGCFALAVESAAVYLGQFADDVTCGGFLARLKREGVKGLDTAASESSEGVLHGEKRLDATLLPTLERLTAPERLALRVVALLPPDHVPLLWVRALVAKTYLEMERDAEPGYPDPWKNVTRRLFGLHLIQPTDAADTKGQPRVVRIHRLVQAVTNQSYPSEVELITNSIIAHAAARAMYLSQGFLARDGWETMALRVLVWFLFWERKLDAAEFLCSHFLQACELTIGNDDVLTVSILRDFALIAEERGDFAVSEQRFRRVVQSFDRLLGSDDFRSVETVIDFSQILQNHGSHQEFEALQTRLANSVQRIAQEKKEHFQYICEHVDPNYLDNTLGMLRSLNNQSYALRKQGRVLSAEPIEQGVAAMTAKVLGDTNPLTIHRRNNLVLTLIMLGKLEEARRILAANWRLNAPPRANTTPRIAFLRHLIALLESQPDTPFLGQLNTLLTGPELPVASDVAVPWDIAYFIEFLKPKLGEHNAEFLTALVAALNDRAKLSALDPFPEWHNQAPVPLDAQGSD